VVPEEVGKVAARLDHIAAGIGAGIVIAGAYGHSRFREWILGGETQHLVEQTARCALLAR
jgi:nucleotide-binding universal stress UspA family protein